MTESGACRELTRQEDTNPWTPSQPGEKIHLCSEALPLTQANNAVEDSSDSSPIVDFTYFFLFRATPAAYGASQARGRIGAAAAGLHHSHSRARSLTH